MTQRTFGQLLREERKRRHWTQEDLAAKLDMDAKTISRWETGNTFPSPHDRERLLSILEKDLLAESNQSNLLLSSHLPARNTYFIGREELLKQMHTSLLEGKTMLALAGLAGIGKTQIAVEYAYRYQEDYQYILWATADSQNALSLDCMHMAKILKLPEIHEQELKNLIDAVKRWLHNHRDWLLILDNVEDPDLVDEFRPRLDQGHLLITTQDAYVFEQTIQVHPMNQEEGSDLLFARSGRSLEQEEREAVAELVKYMDGLPLALDQAAAYIRTAQCGVAQYLQLYQARRKELLEKRGRPVFGHSTSLVATISLTLKKVQGVRGAQDVLEFCAFLHPEHIPEALLWNDESSPFNSHIDADHFLLTEALSALLRYALVSRHPETETLSMHRLVQTVLQDAMPEDRQRQWAGRIIHAVARIFPYVDFFSLQRCERYILHAQMCLQWIERWNIIHADGTRLLRYGGTYFLERGQYAEAETFLRASVSKCERLTTDQFPELPNSLNCLAILYEKLGKYTEAEHLYRRTLSLCEEVLGPEHPDLISILNNLADLSIAQGRWRDAEPLAQRVVSIVEKGNSVNHQDVAHALHTVADLYCAKGEYVLAEPLYRQVVDIREALLGSEHPEVADALNNLAVFYMDQGRLGDAEPLFQRALTISENTLGPDHHFVAFKLNNLAAVAMAQRKFPEAEQMLQRALAIREQALGGEHSEVANSLNTLAVLYEKQGKPTEAIVYLKKALALSEQARGPDHPEVALCLTNLADLYMRQQVYDQVEPLCQRASEIIEKVYGADHPDAIHGSIILARLYTLQGKMADAGTLYQQTLARAQTRLGPEHPHTVIVSQDYADFLCQTEHEVEH